MPTPIPETLTFRSIAQEPREAPAALYTLAHLGGVLTLLAVLS